MLITLSGKGGVGKTSVSALILDELARRAYTGNVLAVDGDPATTLHMALELPEPRATVADVRDSITLDAKTVRSLPPGTTPADHVLAQLREAGVIVSHHLREMPLALMAMGQGEGAGCYCSINRILSVVLGRIMDNYSLVLIDNEAGLEHLSRYRLKQVDVFVVVTTPARSAWAVARRVVDTARQVGMELGEIVTVVNRTAFDTQNHRHVLTNILPHNPAIADLDLEGRAVVSLPDDDPVRVALRPAVERLLCIASEAKPSLTEAG